MSVNRFSGLTFDVVHPVGEDNRIRSAGRGNGSPTASNSACDIPGAKPDLEASTGGRVHAGQVAGQQPRSVERGIEHQIAHANVRHCSGNGDQGWQGRRGLEMVQEQHDVEAQLFGMTGLIDHLRNRPRARKAKAEPHRTFIRAHPPTY